MILRRFFKIYIHEFPGTSAICSTMMEVKGFDEARKIIQGFRKHMGLELAENMRVENYP